MCHLTHIPQFSCSEVVLVARNARLTFAGQNATGQENIQLVME